MALKVRFRHLIYSRLFCEQIPRWPLPVLFFPIWLKIQRMQARFVICVLFWLSYRCKYNWGTGQISSPFSNSVLKDVADNTENTMWIMHLQNKLCMMNSPTLGSTGLHDKKNQSKIHVSQSHGILHWHKRGPLFKDNFM